MKTNMIHIERKETEKGRTPNDFDEEMNKLNRAE